VCAEGIERLDDLRTLADLDVAYGQGYVLAKPQPPWSTPAADALDTLRAALAEALAPGRADHALALAGAQLSRASGHADLAASFGLLARCLHADTLAYSEVAPGRELVTFAHDTWTPRAETYPLDDYPATRHVLETHDVMQVRAGDLHSDPRELALLASLDGGAYRSLLMIPVLAHGAAIGLLEAYSTDDRPWTRQEISRARSISHLLGDAVSRLSAQACDSAGSPAPFSARLGCSSSTTAATIAAATTPAAIQNAR
jgi:GAF domain-containing protein